MVENELVKKVYRSSVEGPNRKGRPFGRWEGKVKEYVSERLRGARTRVRCGAMGKKEHPEMVWSY